MNVRVNIWFCVEFDAYTKYDGDGLKHTKYLVISSMVIGKGGIIYFFVFVFG